MTEDFVHADFNLAKLEREDLCADPVDQFTRWYDEVQAANITEFPAMSLATCGADGRPSVRIVYLRGFDARGFTFYTNYDSRKGHELQQQPWAAVCFFWKEQERQIRIEGIVEKVSAEESDRYFAGRPTKTQLGAWASLQSQSLESAAALQQRWEGYRAQFQDQPVPRPPHWGGYRLVPSRFEFWQGRPSRLHDRFVYEPADAGGWTIQRLNP